MTFLAGLADGTVAPLPAWVGAGTRAACEVIAAWLPRSPYVRWGILEALIVYAEAQAILGRTGDAVAAGNRARDRLDRWVADMPLEGLLMRMSAAEIALDLPELSRTVLTTDAARLAFGWRVAVAAGVEPGSVTWREFCARGYLP